MGKALVREEDKHENDAGEDDGNVLACHGVNFWWYLQQDQNLIQKDKAEGEKYHAEDSQNIDELPHHFPQFIQLASTFVLRDQRSTGHHKAKAKG